MRDVFSCVAFVQVTIVLLASTLCCDLAHGQLPEQLPRVFTAGERPDDARLLPLRTLNGDFPFQAVSNKEDWLLRQEEIKRRILISQGLWPQPTKTPLSAVVHGEVEYDDYTIQRVYFQSIPGHFVTGSLYRPKGKSGPFPAVLCPHGHWQDARFYDAGEKAARQSIAIGAERFSNAARNHMQARCVQLARMGCISFFYDMTGNCDSIQIGHRPDDTDHLDRETDWGFFSAAAELRLLNMMGLQTWNSVRAIDFLLERDDVDPGRIGVTGASGGGTQSMIIAAIDERVAAAMPCVMVSTAMQGGCTCENAPLMRINQGNIDIAAAIAPRPLGITAADDWTVDLKTKGYPELRNLYAMLGQKNRLTAAFHTQFEHNYNHVNRTVMYGFFNRHFKLGLEEPVLESDFELASKEDLSVWNDAHPAPVGDAVGEAHETRLLKIAAQDGAAKVAELIPDDVNSAKEFDSIVGGAWKMILARTIDDVGDIEFRKVRQATHGGLTIQYGTLDHDKMQEQIPIVQVKDAGADSRGVVVWVHGEGKAGLFADSKSQTAVAALARKGYAVVSADLIGQGEFQLDGAPNDAQRMWHQRKGERTWERFSGYTYGYNHSLFVQRVHDALSLIKHASKISPHVHLVGQGSVAGPIALAARSQAIDTVQRTIVDLDGFRFDSLTRQDDPMFVPGAVKYLDVDGLLALCAPHPVTVAGISEMDAAKRVFATSGAVDHLDVRNADMDWIAELASE